MRLCGCCATQSSLCSNLPPWRFEVTSVIMSIQHPVISQNALDVCTMCQSEFSPTVELMAGLGDGSRGLGEGLGKGEGLLGAGEGLGDETGAGEGLGDNGAGEGEGLALQLGSVGGSTLISGDSNTTAAQ